MHGFLNLPPKERTAAGFALFIRKSEGKAENAAAQIKLDDLKRRLCECPEVTPHYFDSAEELGRKVLSTLSVLIEAKFPLSREFTADDLEEAEHVSFSRLAATPHSPIPANMKTLQVYGNVTVSFVSTL